MTQIKVRRATSDDWNSNNPILQDGEPGFSTDNNQLKVGDGSTPWNLLPAAAGLAGVTGPKGPTGPTGLAGSGYPQFTLGVAVRKNEPLAAVGGTLVPIKYSQASTLSATPNAFVTPSPFDAEIPSISSYDEDQIGVVSMILFDSIQKVVTMYSDSTTPGSYIKMRVGTISGDTVTYGSEIVPPQAGYAWGGNPRLVAVGTDKFVLGFSGAAFRPLMYVGQVSGTSITFGAQYQTTFELPDPIPDQYWACPWSMAYDTSYNRLALVYSLNVGATSKMFADSFSISGLVLTSLGINELTADIATASAIQTTGWGWPQVSVGSTWYTGARFSVLTNCTRSDSSTTHGLFYVHFYYSGNGNVPTVSSGPDNCRFMVISLRDNVLSSNITQPSARTAGKFLVTHTKSSLHKLHFGLVSGDWRAVNGVDGPAYIGVMNIDSADTLYIHKLDPNTVQVPPSHLSVEETFFGLSSISIISDSQAAVICSEGLLLISESGTSSGTRRYNPSEGVVDIPVGGDSVFNPTSGKLVVAYRENQNPLEIQTRMLSLGERTSNVDGFVGLTVEAAPAGTPVRVALKGSLVGDLVSDIASSGVIYVAPSGGFSYPGDNPIPGRIRIGSANGYRLALQT